MEKFIDKLKHYFIPDEKNNYKARAIHHDFLTYYLFIAFFISIFLKSSPINFKNVLGFATDITVEKLFSLTNIEREKLGLESLKYNEKLAEAAAEKGKDMFTKNYWAHYSPDGKTTPWDFILNKGYKYEYAGENLAKNFLFSQPVIDAWMNSPSHRENLVKKEFTEVGFAVVNGILNGEETTLVVQMFGKPLTNNQTFTPPKEVQAAEKVTENQVAVVKPTVKKNAVKYSYNITYVFLAFLILVFAIDFFFAARLNIFRINGKNIAHIVFLISMLVAIAFVITKSGAII